MASANPHIRRVSSPLDALIMQAVRRYGEFAPSTIDADLGQMMIEFANDVVDEWNAHPYFGGAAVPHYVSINEARDVDDQVMVAGLVAQYAMQQGSEKTGAYMPRFYKLLNQKLWSKSYGSGPIELHTLDDTFPAGSIPGRAGKTSAPSEDVVALIRSEVAKLPRPSAAFGSGEKGDKGDQGDPGLKGDKGDQGDPGLKGDPGVGVPLGGATGQVLAKTSGADYATGWVTIATDEGGGAAVDDTAFGATWDGDAATAPSRNAVYDQFVALAAAKADADHQHDDRYAPLGHDHDADYAPLAHGHTASGISDFDTEVANNAAVAANTAKRSYPTPDQTKLATIEENATADLTAGEIEALLDAYYGSTDWRGALTVTSFTDQTAYDAHTPGANELAVLYA